VTGPPHPAKKKAEINGKTVDQFRIIESEKEPPSPGTLGAAYHLYWVWICFTTGPGRASYFTHKLQDTLAGEQLSSRDVRNVVTTLKTWLKHLFKENQVCG